MRTTISATAPTLVFADQQVDILAGDHVTLITVRPLAP